MKLEEITPGLCLSGVEPFENVTVVTIKPIGENAIQLYYETQDGAVKSCLLSRSKEDSVNITEAGHSWSFDGNPEAFQLTCEARRIELAHLFDPMMAVHTSNVEPLPHQITAVYESMLPRQPLRFVLADDPGAGKTIMAGLYMRELIMRADAKRILVVAPGSLVEQWKEELTSKFGLDFFIYGNYLETADPNNNPFETYNQLIVRLDQLSRNEDLQQKLCKPGWDLIVVDEAHKLAAHWSSSSKLDKTARYRFGEALSACARHFLLMTATPHNGKEEDFQLFLALLDSDRFYGRFRNGVHKVDVSDLMRRMIKEELVKFDGRPLFPERRAYTVNYVLSALENGLYWAVTGYVKKEMAKTQEMEGRRKGAIGLALTSLQRRLASSPEAIFQSLRRRRERLEKRLEELRALGLWAIPEQGYEEIPEDDDELPPDEQEQIEEELMDDVTAARTIAELETEISVLKGLEKQARGLVDSGQDRKWDELSKILQGDSQMRDASGRQKKLIIFSEHKDTVHYLQRKISGVLGNPKAVIVIHGGLGRDDRLDLQTRFWTDPEVRILVATDAAGEGVNLQVANLMVNYDLPWNPNRLEQRFGRIHRIGQVEVCHLWNLVARETREGEVYHRLLKKLETESQALQGRVFDILGEVFEEESLKSLLIKAIQYGDLPEVREALMRKVDEAMDPARIKELLDRNALAKETMSMERLFEVKEEMEKAEARRLQPRFVKAFFMKAFKTLGGSVYPRESGRFEITHVPAILREKPSLSPSSQKGLVEPIQLKYSRICFEKDAIKPLDKPGLEMAKLMHPGHTLMRAVTGTLLEQNANLLRQGTVLVDPVDDGEDPWMLFLLTHEVKSGDGSTLSKRLQFVRVDSDGNSTFAGWAPHLDLEPLPEEKRIFLKDLIEASRNRPELEQKAAATAAGDLAEEHYREVSERRIAYVDKVHAAVHERLSKEIAFWQNDYVELKKKLEDGADVRLPLDRAKRTLEELNNRLETRKKELQSMRHVANGAPVVLGGALVVPAGLVRKLSGDKSPESTVSLFAADAEAKARIEKIAMDTVRRFEESRGCRVEDVSALKCGWDLTVYPSVDEHLQEPRHVEVKGRAKGATTVTVTRNEIIYAFNQAEKFILAIVLVDENDLAEGPHYIRQPFAKEPDWGVASVNYELHELLKKAEVL